MKKFLTSSIVASALFATAGLAAISDTNTGEVLIAPSYSATNTWSTDLKLVNTSATYSYIYRGVVREKQSSKEFDFIVVLSPLDVWEGSLVNDSGKVYFKSSDDSNYAYTDTANKTIYKNITDHTGVKTFDAGYVEFYPIAALNVKNTTENDLNTKVDKDELRAAFKGLSDLNAQKTTFNFPKSSATNVTAEVVKADKAFVAGYATLVSKDFKQQMTLNMRAFNGVVDRDTVPLASSIVATANTVPENYLDKDGVTRGTGTVGVKQLFEDLKVSSVTVPYEAKGLQDGIYFTFWNDLKDKQVRTANILLRNMTEDGAKAKDEEIFSGAPEANPETFKIENERARVSVKLNIYDKIAPQLNPDVDYSNGLVKIYNLANGSATGQKEDYGLTTPSALVTTMSAKYVDGDASFSWNYAPVSK